MANPEINCNISKITVSERIKLQKIFRKTLSESISNKDSFSDNLINNILAENLLVVEDTSTSTQLSNILNSFYIGARKEDPNKSKVARLVSDFFGNVPSGNFAKKVDSTKFKNILNNIFNSKKSNNKVSAAPAIDTLAPSSETLENPDGALESITGTIDNQDTLRDLLIRAKQPLPKQDTSFYAEFIQREEEDAEGPSSEETKNYTFILKEHFNNDLELFTEFINYFRDNLVKLALFNSDSGQIISPSDVDRNIKNYLSTSYTAEQLVGLNSNLQKEAFFKALIANHFNVYSEYVAEGVFEHKDGVYQLKQSYKMLEGWTDDDLNDSFKQIPNLFKLLISTVYYTDLSSSKGQYITVPNLVARLGEFNLNSLSSDVDSIIEELKELAYVDFVGERQSKMLHNFFNIFLNPKNPKSLYSASLATQNEDLQNLLISELRKHVRLGFTYVNNNTETLLHRTLEDKPLNASIKANLDSSITERNLDKHKNNPALKHIIDYIESDSLFYSHVGNAKGNRPASPNLVAMSLSEVANGLREYFNITITPEALRGLDDNLDIATVLANEIYYTFLRANHVIVNSSSSIKSYDLILSSDKDLREVSDSFLKVFLARRDLLAKALKIGKEIETRSSHTTITGTLRSNYTLPSRLAKIKNNIANYVRRIKTALGLNKDFRYPLEDNIFFTEAPESTSQAGLIKMLNIKGAAVNPGSFISEEGNSRMKEYSTFAYNFEYLFLEKLEESNMQEVILDLVTYSDKSTNYAPSIDLTKQLNNKIFDKGTVLRDKQGFYRSIESLKGIFYQNQKSYYTKLEQVIVSKYKALFKKLNLTEYEFNTLEELQNVLVKAQIPINKIESFVTQNKSENTKSYFVKGRDYVKHKVTNDEGKKVTIGLLDAGLLQRTKELKQPYNDFRKELQEELEGFKSFVKELGFTKSSKALAFIKNMNSDTLSRTAEIKNLDDLLEYYFIIWSIFSTNLTQINMGDIHQFEKSFQGNQDGTYTREQAYQAISNQFISSTKRNSAMTSSGTAMHTGGAYTVDHTSKVALFKDPELEFMGMLGDSFSQEIMDGAFLTLMTESIKRQKTVGGVLGNFIGIIQKPVNTFYNAFNSSIIFDKNAEFPITNEDIRRAGDMNLALLVKKMMSLPFQSQDNKKFKSKIESIIVAGEKGNVSIEEGKLVLAVDVPLKNPTYYLKPGEDQPTEVTHIPAGSYNNMYEIWDLLGNAYTIDKTVYSQEVHRLTKEPLIVYNNDSWYALVDFEASMHVNIKDDHGDIYDPIKGNYVSKIGFDSSRKSGAGAYNEVDLFNLQDDEESLSFLDIPNDNLLIQINPAKNPDNAKGAMITQIINAVLFEGNNPNLYKDISIGLSQLAEFSMEEVASKDIEQSKEYILSSTIDAIRTRANIGGVSRLIDFFEKDLDSLSLDNNELFTTAVTNTAATFNKFIRSKVIGSQHVVKPTHKIDKVIEIPFLNGRPIDKSIYLYSSEELTKIEYVPVDREYYNKWKIRTNNATDQNNYLLKPVGFEKITNESIVYLDGELIPVSDLNFNIVLDDGKELDSLSLTKADKALSDYKLALEELYTDLEFAKESDDTQEVEELLELIEDYKSAIIKIEDQIEEFSKFSFFEKTKSDRELAWKDPYITIDGQTIYFREFAAELSDVEASILENFGFSKEPTYHNILQFYFNASKLKDFTELKEQILEDAVTVENVNTILKVGGESSSLKLTSSISDADFNEAMSVYFGYKYRQIQSRVTAVLSEVNEEGNPLWSKGHTEITLPKLYKTAFNLKDGYSLHEYNVRYFEYDVIEQEVNKANKELTKLDSADELYVMKSNSINQKIKLLEAIKEELDSGNTEFIADNTTYKKINAKAIEVHKNFLKSLEGVLARIPAQGLQSFFSFKVVSFTHDNLNALGYPIEMLYYQGADMDIDKGNAMMYEVVDKKIQLWYNGKIEDMDKTPLDTKYLLEGVANWKKRKNKESFDPSNILSPKQVEAALKNLITNRLIQAGLVANNSVPGNTAVNMTIPKKYSDLVKKKNEEEGKSPSFSERNPLSQVFMVVANRVGKSMVGIMAQDLKAYGALYYATLVNIEGKSPTSVVKASKGNPFITNIPFNDSNLENIQTLLAYQYISEKYPGTTLNKEALDKHLDEFKSKITKEYNELLLKGEIEIQTWNALSQLLSAATDNAKHLYLKDLNADTFVGSFLSAMMVSGVKFDEVLKLTTSEEMRALIKAADYISSSFSKEELFLNLKKAAKLAFDKSSVSSQVIEEISEAYKDVCKLAKSIKSKNVFKLIYKWAEIAEEYNFLGRTLGINQGITTEIGELLESTRKFELFVNNIYKEANEELDKKINNKTATAKEIELSESGGIKSDFELNRFLSPDSDMNYIKYQINKFGEHMKKFNALSAIFENKQYYSYLRVRKNLISLFKEQTYKFNYTLDFLKLLDTEGFSDRKIDSNTIKSITSAIEGVIIDKFLVNKSITIEGEEVSLSSPAGRTKFINWANEYFIPEVKARHSELLFSNLYNPSTVQDRYLNSEVVIYGVDDMIGMEKGSTLSQNQVLQMASELEKLHDNRATIDNKEIAVMLYYYNLITTKGDKSKNSIARILPIKLMLPYNNYQNQVLREYKKGNKFNIDIDLLSPILIDLMPEVRDETIVKEYTEDNTDPYVKITKVDPSLPYKYNKTIKVYKLVELESGLFGYQRVVYNYSSLAIPYSTNGMNNTLPVRAAVSEENNDNKAITNDVDHNLEGTSHINLSINFGSELGKFLSFADPYEFTTKVSTSQNNEVKEQEYTFQSIYAYNIWKILMTSLERHNFEYEDLKDYIKEARGLKGKEGLARGKEIIAELADKYKAENDNNHFPFNSNNSENSPEILRFFLDKLEKNELMQDKFISKMNLKLSEYDLEIVDDGKGENKVFIKNSKKPVSELHSSAYFIRALKLKLVSSNPELASFTKPLDLANITNLENPIAAPDSENPKVEGYIDQEAIIKLQKPVVNETLSNYESRIAELITESESGTMKDSGVIVQSWNEEHKRQWLNLQQSAWLKGTKLSIEVHEDYYNAIESLEDQGLKEKFKAAYINKLISNVNTYLQKLNKPTLITEGERAKILASNNPFNESIKLIERKNKVKITISKLDVLNNQLSQSTTLKGSLELLTSIKQAYLELSALEGISDKEVEDNLKQYDEKIEAIKEQILKEEKEAINKINPVSNTTNDNTVLNSTGKLDKDIAKEAYLRILNNSNLSPEDLVSLLEADKVIEKDCSGK